MDNILLDADQFDRTPVFVENAFNKLPSWDDVIADFDLEVKTNWDQVKDTGNLGVVTHFAEKIPEVNEIRKFIHSLRPNELKCTAHLYISFLSTSHTFGWHSDTTDVFYVQAKGNTVWEVEFESKVTQYILSPGDLIYVPKFIKHNTIPQSPRVGISLGFN